MTTNLEKVHKKERMALRNHIKKYIKLQEQIKELEVARDELKALIKKAMADCNISRMEVANHKASYYSSLRTNFMNEEFKKDHPRLYRKYTYSTNHTYFKVAPIGAKNEVH